MVVITFPVRSITTISFVPLNVRPSELSRIFTRTFVMVARTRLASKVKTNSCASKDRADVKTLQEHVTAGPFYKAPVGQVGKPVSCRLDVEDGKLTLTYAFRSHMELTAFVDGATESNEQRMRMARMDMAKAITLLKAAEQDAYSPKGCGIAWDHPAEESVKDGAHETVYRGTVCNCQARVTSRSNYVLSLVLRSAC
jgi:hypothetical protein